MDFHRNKVRRCNWTHLAE